MADSLRNYHLEDGATRKDAFVDPGPRRGTRGNCRWVSGAQARAHGDSKRGKMAKTKMYVRRQIYGGGSRGYGGRGKVGDAPFFERLFFHLLWHRLMGNDEVAHVDFTARGTRPRHCPQSVQSEPVERYYGRATVVRHLVVCKVVKLCAG